MTRGSGRGSRRGTGRTTLVLVGIVTAVVLALFVAVVLGDGDEDNTATTDPSDLATTGTVVASGESLPEYTGQGDDPAVGMTLPTLTGTDQAGVPMVIGDSGRPTMIVFLAHWCPHCQAEVPVIQEWVDGNGRPSGVDLVSVSTAIDPNRPNYPPDAWLNREGWTSPVLVDADGTAAAAVGLAAFPFFVTIDADGTVVTRVTGELSLDDLDALAAELT